MKVTRWTARELESMPTLTVGQTSDLKVDENGVRFWLARTSIEDGEPYEHTVYVEHVTADGVIQVEAYDGDPMAWGYSWQSTITLED